MRKAIAVIGEGITEKYYIESLKGLSPFTLVPRELNKKASSLKVLENDIKLCIAKGYDEVYCLIDMDGKNNGKAQFEYLSLKKKYHNKTHGKLKERIQCKVVFVETERCIELWFLYYFVSNVITKKFNSYDELEKELKKYRPNYEKTAKYFKTIGNIHENFENIATKGSLINACKNSKLSLISNFRDERGYTYSEMHILMIALDIWKEIS